MNARLILPPLVSGLLAIAGCRETPTEPTDIPRVPGGAATQPATGTVPGGAVLPAGENGAIDAPREVDGSGRVSVDLASASGSSVQGQLALTKEGDGVRIRGRITGLPPDASFGFHVHETGDCSAPDASSAGEHFNPGNSAHGHPGSPPHHAGDMPNVSSDAQGAAEVDLKVDALQLGGGGAHDISGRAVVVHAKPDDYRSQPSGDAGERIGCGVIGTPPRATL